MHAVNPEPQEVTTGRSSAALKWSAGTPAALK
eukprot:CAMPEP_0171274186 /NCGR_PEP_ID=MMETSP0790-20130122/62683_1 /TAXON_ID=2925 /ORGANISM="Alexandrium catenella, Strain OF101" /LENGTH=31 /DNA_ID= /DNA_START= /DNA_END= /DNA_ORIENTATION=